jgi:hypothetical protein
MPALAILRGVGDASSGPAPDPLTMTMTMDPLRKHYINALGSFGTSLEHPGYRSLAERRGIHRHHQMPSFQPRTVALLSLPLSANDRSPLPRELIGSSSTSLCGSAHSDSVLKSAHHGDAVPSAATGV